MHVCSMRERFDSVFDPGQRHFVYFLAVGNRIEEVQGSLYFGFAAWIGECEP